jgi:hypothetical protein
MGEFNAAFGQSMQQKGPFLIHCVLRPIPIEPKAAL